MEKLTKKQADIEAQKIFAERNKEADRIIEEAKKNGTWKMGLDSNRDLFKDLDKRTWDKIQELASRIEE